MAQSKFTLYKYFKLKDGSGVTARLPFIQTEKSSPAGASSIERRRNIPRAPTIFITTESGFPWALTHWRHNARGTPVPKHKHGNPERTLANKVGDVRIFLKELGITKLLKKHEEPKCQEKKVVAHPDDELDVLYGSADGEETFLLDFFVGSMARDCEAYGRGRGLRPVWPDGSVHLLRSSIAV